jgi:DHA1 family bicyclomycin/chloramphenicol resistance-like MFS transporter
VHTSHYFRNAVILGLLTAVGPFAVDMYLPALPAIGTGLNAEPAQVMLSLTSYFIAFGLLQIIFGTISDVYGRKLPLYFGLGLFVAAGIGCALAHDIKTLIALRFLQGVGGAAGIIVPRAIVRDLYSGVEEVKMMSLLMLIFSVSPLLAPLAGSFLVQGGEWQLVFWALSAIGVAGLALLIFGVRETLPKDKRIKANVADLKRAYGVLLRDRAFVGMTLIGAFAITAFFIYLGTSSFVLKEAYGFTSREYSLAFSANALAFFAAAQLNGWLSQKFGINRIMIPAAIGFAGTMCGVAALSASGAMTFWHMAVMLFIAFSFVGILLPTIMVLALADHGDIAGTAASLMNTVQLMVGSGAIALSGHFMDGTPATMLRGMALSAILTLVFTFWTFGQKKKA